MGNAAAAGFGNMDKNKFMFMGYKHGGICSAIFSKDEYDCDTLYDIDIFYKRKGVSGQRNSF